MRTDWRTCLTPTWLPLRWLTDFPRFRCSLPGTKALALPVSRSRTPPGRHLGTAGSQVGGKTSPPPNCRTAVFVRQNCVKSMWEIKKKEEEKQGWGGPLRSKGKVFKPKSERLRTCSGMRSKQRALKSQLPLFSRAGCDLINNCAPTDAPGPEVSRLISQIQFEVDALIGIPYLSLQAPPRLEQCG